MKNLSMQYTYKKKLQFIFLLLFFFFATLTTSVIYNFHANQENEYLKQVTQTYTKSYENAYFEKKQLSKILVTGLMKMGKLPYRLSLIKKDPTQKTKLRLAIYRNLLARYKELKTMGIDQLHIHLNNNESFLRMHKPKVYGDNLTHIRPTVAYVNKYHKPIDSMEEGKIYFGLRFVYPIFYKQQHVGSIEVSYGVASLMQSIMGQYNVVSNFFINQKIADKKNIQNTMYKLSKYPGYYCDKRVLSLLKNHTIPLDTATQNIIQKMSKKTTPHSLLNTDNQYTITIIPVINKLSNKNIAFVSILSKAKHPIHYVIAMYLSAIGFLALSFYLIYTLYFQKQELQLAVQEKTKEQQNLLSLFDKGDIVLFRWHNDPHWSIDFVSQNSYKLLGYTKEEFLSKNVVYSNIIYKEDLAFLSQEVQNALEEKKDFFTHKPYRIITKDGSIRWMLDHTLLVRNTRDEVTHFLGYIVDITNLKEQEDILQIKIQEALAENIKQLEILQQQNKMASMGEMMGAIAHQWRQPLNIISTSIQNLKYDFIEGKLNEKHYIDEFILKNKKTIKFMSKTIDDFRSFFRVDKEKTNFDVKETIESVVSMLIAQLNNHNITLEIQGDTFISYGLPNEFQQVILNLINNAKDALLEKEVQNAQIKITLSQPNIITIQDNAGGIENAIMQRVFEPYFTTKDQGKGTGMGLYMSKMIIEDNMNGKLEVANVDDGAFFIIHLNKENI